MNATTAYRFLVATSGEDCIKSFVWNSDTRELTCQQTVPAKTRPGPLAVSRDERFLYAGLRGSRQIAVYHCDRDSAGSGPVLQPHMQAELDADPCFLRMDATGQWLLAAYYGAGQVTVHGISPDGGLTPEPVQRVATGPKAHCIGINTCNSMVWVPHVGQENAVHEFQLDPATGQLSRTGIRRAAEDPLVGPVGPRHCAFHESTRSIYFCNEQGSSVTHHVFDDTGLAQEGNTLSTLPGPYGTANTCAQIHGDPAGRFLYVSNRGHNSLAIFAIAPESGALTARGWQETEPVPRAFAITPDSRHVLCGGLASGCLSIYGICGATGHLDLQSRRCIGSEPMWILPLRL